MFSTTYTSHFQVQAAIQKIGYSFIIFFYVRIEI